MLTLHRSKCSALLSACSVLIAGFLTGIVLLAIGPGAARAQLDPIYVDGNAADPTPDGASWTSAFTNVQDALAAAAPGDEIWVAEGVYYPDEGAGQTNDDPTSTFTMTPGVALYGGFAATEALRTQRDWEANITVLSGDIDENDQVTDAGVVTGTGYINGTNAHHVVTGGGVTETARLDGFTVTAGDATGDTALPRGGGMQNVGSHPTVGNVTFSGNEASAGGGMYNAGCSPSLSGLTFTGNRAETGGGMHNASSSNPTVDDVRFSFNSALTGGGMYNQNSSPTVNDAVFVGNHAWGSGGGMYNEASSSPTLTDVSFTGNSVASVSDFGDTLGCGGGGMYNHQSSPALTSVAFRGNWVLALDGGGAAGGGMYNEASSSPTLTDVTFVDNTAAGGGGMFNTGSSPALIDCSFSGNEAGGMAEAAGGGMLNMGASHPRLTQVTFSQNRSQVWGGGLANAEGSNPPLSQVTFSGNEAEMAGGGMYNLDSSPAVTGATFISNVARAPDDGATAGGGIANFGGSPTLTNVLFSGNWASYYGGGLVSDGGHPFLTNVTFAGNMVDPPEDEYADELSAGGGMCVSDGSATLINCVLAGNEARNGPQIGYLRVITTAVSTATIRYSAIQGSGGSGSGWDAEVGIDGGGNIDADPLFVAPVAASAAPTTAGDYRLSAGSPAVDAGNSDAVAATTDLDGDPRIADGDGDGSAVVDMGAYEREGVEPRAVGGTTVAPSYWPPLMARGVIVALIAAVAALAVVSIAPLARRW